MGFIKKSVWLNNIAKELLKIKFEEKNKIKLYGYKRIIFLYHDL